MGENWTLQSRFQAMMEVEIAVAQAQAELGIIPKAAAKAIAKKSKFDVDRIAEIEKETKHDVIAFVSNVAENVGPHGRYVHYGLTSSDVLDTALSLMTVRAGGLVSQSLDLLEEALLENIELHMNTLCAGRTHGMHAEPTSFGFKLSGFLSELRRNRVRFQMALEEMAIVKLSGAVGTYSTGGEQVEKRVGELLGLKPELVATQVIPRDRHANLIHSLALIVAGLERLSVELRHLQRTEVAEVVEGFTKGQKGSSAMPHKKNPISAENITGVARLLRGYASSAMENVALWHERDISHSSVERVVFPDAFILTDYALARMAGVIESIEVNEERMLDNMAQSRGALFSSHVLLKLVDKGLSREDAYKIVQRVSHSMNGSGDLQSALLDDAEVKKYLVKKDLEPIFSGKTHQKAISKVVKRAMKSKTGTFKMGKRL
jgi:adenylosuccinate lyase